MYYQKPFCISVLLLVCLSQLTAVQISCSSDSDCSGGQGVCTTIGSSSYCSCLSGFGGDDCSVRPDSACAGSFGAVSATASTLQTSSSLSYLYPNLTLTVTANLEESKYAFPDLNDTLNVVPFSEELSIIFGNGRNPMEWWPRNERRHQWDTLDWLENVMRRLNVIPPVLQAVPSELDDLKQTVARNQKRRKEAKQKRKVNAEQTQPPSLKRSLIDMTPPKLNLTRGTLRGRGFPSQHKRARGGSTVSINSQEDTSNSNMRSANNNNNNNNIRGRGPSRGGTRGSWRPPRQRGSN